MAKARRDDSTQLKKPIPMSALFQKTAMKKRGQKLSMTVEHPLATILSSTLNQSKEQIKARIDTELSAVMRDQGARLTKIQNAVLRRGHEMNYGNESTAHAFKSLELHWESRDKVHSGKTTLAARMKKFDKVLKSEEESIIGQCREVADLDHEIRAFAVEIVGKVNFDRILAGTQDRTMCCGAQEQNLRSEIEAVRAHHVEGVGSIKKASIKTMRESEKALNLRHDVVQQSVYAMLRDDEDQYC